MKKNYRKNRRLWFRILCFFLRILFGIIYHPPIKITYLGDEFESGAVILFNHAGAFGPVAIELNLKKVIRFWGTYEMTLNIKESYRYLSTAHFQVRRKHSPKKAKFLALISCPLTTIFYKGLRLIPTYPDVRMKTTIAKTIKELENGQNIVIFPEDITEGYFDELTSFHGGFYVLAEKAYKKGIDLPIYVSNYNKKNRSIIYDKKIMFSELKQTGLSRNEICQMLCARCNELGKMKIEA